MEEERNSGGCLGIIVFIIFIAFVLHAFRGFQNPTDDYSQSTGGFLGIGVQYPSKIMKYTGANLMLVCKLPYSDSDDCYYLKVSSNGEVFTRINFNNGGYLYLDDVECATLASIYNNKGDYRFFCTAYDTLGNEWDIFSPGTNITF